MYKDTSLASRRLIKLVVLFKVEYFVEMVNLLNSGFAGAEKKKPELVSGS